LTATWDVTTDRRGRILLALRLRDQTGAQSTFEFVPSEVQYHPQLVTVLDFLKEGLLHIRWWRDQLARLFANLRQWCQALPGGVSIQEEAITLREVRSGEYEVPRMVVTSNGHTMTIDPVAAWVVGADGRVDLNGIGGPLTLMYSQEKDEWYYLPHQIPVVTLPLTEDLFLKLAEECLYG
jgi:hypothetical protein